MRLLAMKWKQIIKLLISLLEVLFKWINNDKTKKD